LHPFAEVHPNVRIQLTLGSTHEIMGAVAEGHADIGLAYNPGTHTGVRSVASSRQPLYLIVAPALAPNFPDRTTLFKVSKESLALLTDEHGVRRLLARVEADQGFHLVPHIESGSIDVVRRFAISGRGVTFLPRFAASSEIAEGRLAAVPLQDPLLVEATAHLLIRSQRRLPATVEQLVSQLAVRMQAFNMPDPEGNRSHAST
jgi:DNA-binding transcriptional LysR family regulator